MKSRPATTVAAAALLALCCGIHADCKDDRSAAERHDEQRSGSETRQSTNRADSSKDGHSSKQADVDRPAMPIPIPGVGRAGVPRDSRRAESTLQDA